MLDVHILWSTPSGSTPCWWTLGGFYAEIGKTMYTNNFYGSQTWFPELKLCYYKYTQNLDCLYQVTIWTSGGDTQLKLVCSCIFVRMNILFFSRTNIALMNELFLKTDRRQCSAVVLLYHSNNCVLARYIRTPLLDCFFVKKPPYFVIPNSSTPIFILDFFLWIRRLNSPSLVPASPLCSPVYLHTQVEERRVLLWMQTKE